MRTLCWTILLLVALPGACQAAPPACGVDAARMEGLAAEASTVLLVEPWQTQADLSVPQAPDAAPRPSLQEALEDARRHAAEDRRTEDRAENRTEATGQLYRVLDVLKGEAGSLILLPLPQAECQDTQSGLYLAVLSGERPARMIAVSGPSDPLVEAARR